MYCNEDMTCLFFGSNGAVTTDAREDECRSRIDQRLLKHSPFGNSLRTDFESKLVQLARTMRLSSVLHENCLVDLPDEGHLQQLSGNGRCKSKANANSL